MPFIILIACAWIIGSIAEKAMKKQKLKKLQEEAESNRYEELARINAASQAYQARLIREKAEKERAARQKAIDAENKKRLDAMKKAAADAEKAEKAERERLYKINLAKREIDYCSSVLEDLNKRLDTALIDLEYAKLSRKSGDSLYKYEKAVDDLKANIYRTENRIEKAYHTLSMCNA